MPAWTDLTDSEMAEAANQLCPVEGVCGLLHAAHGGHLPVPFEQVLLRYANVE